MTKKVFEIKHPLIQHKLTLMRRRETGVAQFRTLLKEISLLLGYEVFRDLSLQMVDIETPLEAMKAPLLEGKKIVFVPILRAGMGILDGMLELIPSARVGHIGLYRDPATLTAVEYYLKLPPIVADRDMVVLDPMLATGNSAVAAVHRLKEVAPRSMKLVTLVSCPQGIENFHEEHPEVPIYTAAIDQKLNDHGYILPGIGDAGDRLFGTK